MIGYISGTIQAIADKYVIVNVNGVGYRVVIPEKIRNSLSEIGQEVKLYTHFTMNPRDGSTELFGFDSPEELNFFELMTTVSGIGPKTAQGILSSANLQDLQLSIVSKDDKYLSKVSGVGTKTAQRLILELKNKIMTADLGGKTAGDLSSEGEAMDALESLGYSKYQAREALKNMDKKITKTEDKITEALKLLGTKK
ncbi:MAG: Holliday junction branch migration protein RuvA [bacterium]|nr:Holliday junction branch migration protein RuvA [bacterium]